MQADGPNAEQIEYWSGRGGPTWVEHQRQLDASIHPYGDAAMQRGAPAPGERVLDIGCGCGQTTLQLSERVAPGGSVTGIDISDVMLDRARGRARDDAAAGVRFENADAQTHDFAPGSFDLAFSRFGVMFFIDPVAAFENVARALTPGGRLAFVCWQEVAKNPWALVPMAAAAKHLELPPRPEPGAPGPFAFGDGARVRGILESAGYTDVGLEPFEHAFLLGGGLDAAVEFVTRIGPTARLLVDAPAETRTRVADALREALTAHLTDEGVRLASATWLVTARKPGSP